jgi:hypothetical protein
MTPHAALDLQIARYRAMTREERVGIALRLHELACEMARLGFADSIRKLRHRMSRNCCASGLNCPAFCDRAGKPKQT